MANLQWSICNLSVCFAFLLSAIPTRADITPPIDRSTTQWQFLSDDVDPGPTWRDANFDDSAWSAGFGLFGADGGYDTPFLTPLTSSSLTRVHYFRTHFTWSGDTVGAILNGRLYLDDGCVIWINGVEVYRENVGDDPVTHRTLALSANPRGEPVQFNFELDLSTNASNPLIIGDNVIAVSLHEDSTTSDKVFGLDLTTPSAPTIDDLWPCPPTPSPSRADPTR